MKDKIKGVLYLGIIVLIVILFFNYIQTNNIKFYDNNILSRLINDFDYVNMSEDGENYSILEKINISDIVNLEYKNISFINKNTNITLPTLNEKVNKGKINKEVLPIVYIYNTHNKEQYSYDKNAPYNIIPTVMNTSYMLKEKLSKYDIESIVEESDVSNVLKKNKWNYASSYRATRLFLEKAKNENPSLNYFIDIHRDSAKKNVTTLEINKIKYAKVLFILGLENKDYKKNSKMIEYINNEINKKYPNLSRGIYKKKGRGVNGVYNQDFSPNCILIEFGGSENTIDEVYNTVEVVGEVLADYIGEENENK